jgi:formylglycine-generating enzyme required for sulfatase activity
VSKSIHRDGNHHYYNGRKNEDRNQTVAVKVLPCNNWGLYQMHGNVWEWCQDRYGDYPSQPVIDSQGPESGAYRVLRGGSWINRSRFCRSAFRHGHDPSNRFNFTGFRLAQGH